MGTLTRLTFSLMINKMVVCLKLKQYDQLYAPSIIGLNPIIIFIATAITRLFNIQYEHCTKIITSKTLSISTATSTHVIKKEIQTSNKPPKNIEIQILPDMNIWGGSGTNGDALDPPRLIYLFN